MRKLVYVLLLFPLFCYSQLDFNGVVNDKVTGTELEKVLVMVKPRKVSSSGYYAGVFTKADGVFQVSTSYSHPLEIIIMKKILILLITIPLLSLNTINNNKFIGKWIGESKGEIGYISFDKEGYAVFEIQGQIFGGKEFVLNGKKGMMTYKINNKVNPIEIDLIVTKIESKEEMKLLCIANFKNENEMEFAINFENKRPVDFNTKDSIILKREK